MPLESLISALYASEINCGMQTFYDGGLEVWVGDEMNGRKERRTFEVGHFSEAATWLAEAAVRAYPESVFAKGGTNAERA